MKISFEALRKAGFHPEFSETLEEVYITPLDGTIDLHKKLASQLSMETNLRDSQIDDIVHGVVERVQWEQIGNAIR